MGLTDIQAGEVWSSFLEKDEEEDEDGDDDDDDDDGDDDDRTKGNWGVMLEIGERIWYGKTRDEERMKADGAMVEGSREDLV